MNADRLLDLYERVPEAPDAVPRLRRFVLDLAVRGRLVRQEAGDEPASELLKRIAAEKARLVKVGEIRKPKPLSEVSTDEQDFPAPSGWAWSRLGGLTLITQGFAFSSGDYSKNSEEGPPLIKIGDIGSNSPEVFIKGAFDDTYLVKPGELLLGLSGSIKCARWEGPAALLNQRIARILPATNDLTDGWLFLAVDRCLDKWKSETSKLTVQNIKAKQLSEALVPLPPLVEQRRIVAKVEELMALLDRLEAARTAREATRDRLTAASLARLTASDSGPDADAPGAEPGKVDTGFPSGSATNKDDFPANARFALATLPALTTRPDQIKPFRQTILNLAVRGKLVAQDPADEPASELLKRIEVAKVERKKEKGDRRIKIAPDPSPDELDMPLPSGWAAQSFENLFLFIDYRGRTPPKTDSGIPLITAKNIRMGSLNREPREYISEATFEAWMTRGFPEIGDLFFTTEAPLANICLNDVDEPFALAQRAICFQPYAKIDTKFLMFALMSDVMQSLIDKHATGMTAKGIKAAKLKPLPIPLPPLAEQHRIVAKVDALMDLCDRLESALATTDTTRARLLEALLHEALEPSATGATEAAE